jgi:predicted Zn-dependent protease with MMP-like domain
MIEMTDEAFEALIATAMDALPSTHADAVRNVAVVYADEPTTEQRHKQQLRSDQTLFGLYEGVPLPARSGNNDMYGPDKITIFKRPILQQSASVADAAEHVRHTIWHEFAHYFGLNHEQIHALE